jgi:hypothetical protein
VEKQASADAAFRPQAGRDLEENQVLLRQRAEIRRAVEPRPQRGNPAFAGWALGAKGLGRTAIFLGPAKLGEIQHVQNAPRPEHDLRANVFRVCREGKSVSTFPDLALDIDLKIA